MPNAKRQQEHCVPEIEVTKGMHEAGIDAIGDLSAFSSHEEKATAMYRATARKDKNRLAVKRELFG